jgi:predicted transcriptional regulator
MTLKQYLKASGETHLDFSQRSGINYRTFQRIAAGSVPSLESAILIVQATEDQPIGKLQESVSFEELAGLE